MIGTSRPWSVRSCCNSSPTQARHSDIEDQTRHPIASVRLQISLSRFKGLASESQRKEEVNSRQTNRFVVIYHGNHPIGHLRLQKPLSR